jgi:hypothetical protein
MANELIEYLKGKRPKGFRCKPFYSKEGDFLTYYFKGVDHYAERIDEILTVYRATEGNQFVGFKLKGVAHLLKTLGDLQVRVFDDDGNLQLSLLLMAGTMKTRRPSALPVYQQFARETANVPIGRKELQHA